MSKLKILCITTIIVFTSVSFIYPKGKEKITKSQKETLNIEILKFKEERKTLIERLIDHEKFIQNLKYRISQINFLIEYLEKKENKK